MVRLIFVLTLITAVGISGLPWRPEEGNSIRPNEGNSTRPYEGNSLLSEDGLFEGDLKLSEAFIRAHYDLSSLEGLERGSNRGKRSAANSIVRLWVDGIVPYDISESTIPDYRHLLIRKAMDRWEDATCLRFVPRRSYHDDYIYFQNIKNSCYSNSIGRKGGKQIINLGEDCSYGNTLHEIAHGIGFWHEQSRPDRDSFVQVNIDNVEAGEGSNFMKLDDFKVNYQDSSYDYGSIMHYPQTAFVKSNCPGCKTIQITNAWAYMSQGQPPLGQRTDLSSSDIKQMNRLYLCPGPSECGGLTIKVKYGIDLMDTDWVGKPDPYVEIVAVDKWGARYVRKTESKSGTQNPTWNKTFHFKRWHWQFFRIRVWDDDYIPFFDVNPDPMSMSETVVVIPGFHTSQKHCHDTECEGYIQYDYSLV